MIRTWNRKGKVNLFNDRIPNDTFLSYSSGIKSEFG